MMGVGGGGEVRIPGEKTGNRCWGDGNQRQDPFEAPGRVSELLLSSMVRNPDLCIAGFLSGRAQPSGGRRES